MTNATRPEDAAVPEFDVVAETAEAVGEATADAAPEPDEQERREAARTPSRPTGGDRGGAWDDQPGRGPVTDPAEAPGTARPDAIGGDEPWGTDGDSPMGEGSDETAAPPVDPGERRLSGA
jgi:hypothetical protein